MSRKVLVADDDKATRRLVVRALNAVGVSDVAEAADGDEALALFEEHEFDLIITDWDMPGKSGLELVQAIRAKDAEIPVVMVTGEAKEERVREAIDAGITGYVVKPFDQDALREKLAGLCKGIDRRVSTAVYRCRNVMNTDVITIKADATVGDAIACLLQRGISGLPVVDDRKQLIGLITEFELVQVIARPDIKEQPVSTLMTTNVMTVKEDTIPLEVVNMMQQHRIRRVPVVRNGEVVGMISRRDILRFAMENEEALREFLDTLRSVAGV